MAKAAQASSQESSHGVAEARAASAAEPAQASQTQAENSNQAQDEEDPNECGWCRWMKGGGCKEQFEVWLKCVDGIRDAGRDDVETCSSVMGPLWDCMQKNSDYYSPQLDALQGKSPEQDTDTSKQSSSSKGQDGRHAAGSESLGDLVDELGEDLADAVDEILGSIDDDIDTGE